MVEVYNNIVPKLLLLLFSVELILVFELEFQSYKLDLPYLLPQNGFISLVMIYGRQFSLHLFLFYKIIRLRSYLLVEKQRQSLTLGCLLLLIYIYVNCNVHFCEEG